MTATTSVCERAFLPDDVDAYHRARTPCSPTSPRRPVSDADVLALSVAYETEVIGVLDCLELSGVALCARDRTHHDPLVIFGGPLTFSNPLPVAPFADVIVMGEGDELVGRTAGLVRQTTEPSRSFCATWRCSRRLCARDPWRVLDGGQADDASCPPTARSSRPTPSCPHAPGGERARVPSRLHVLRDASHHEHGDARGGAEPSSSRRSQTTPDAWAWSARPPSITPQTQADPGAPSWTRAARLGLSSLRADRLTTDFVELLARGGARTLTVASDGSSARMRKIAKKNIKEQAPSSRRRARGSPQAQAAQALHGHRLPRGDHGGHGGDDATFLLELSKICRVALGMSPLVARRTPRSMALRSRTPPPSTRKIKHVHKHLGRKVEIRSTSVRWSWIEYHLAQGGWAMADVAVDVWKDGGGYAAWKKAIKRHGFTPAALYKPATERLTPGARLGEEHKLELS